MATSRQFFEHYHDLTMSQLASGEEYLSLAIIDSAMNGGQEGVYKVPLCSVPPRTTEGDKECRGSRHADVELVHLYPLIHNTLDKDKQQATALPPGFVYLFVDGYLWREVKVERTEAGGCYFRDINLGLYRGNRDWQAQGRQRPVSGERLGTLLVPHMLANTLARVEIAYSETQWCWDYILKLGGLNPRDPRLYSGPPLSISEIICPDDAAAIALRHQRMQCLKNLGNYISGYADTSQAGGNANGEGSVESGEGYQEIIPHFAPEQLAVVVLTNGLHLVRCLAAKIQGFQAAIQLHLNELQGIDMEDPDNIDELAKTRYDLACFMMQTFYYKPDAILHQEVDLATVDNGQSEAAIEFAKHLKQWRTSELDEEQFFDYLGYDKMMCFANETADVRRQLIAYLKDCDSPCHFVRCFEDYGYYCDVHFSRTGEILEVLAGVLKNHPAQLFAHLIRDEGDWQALAAEDEGQDFLLTCLDQHPDKPCHPIARVLFPRSEGESLSQYSRHSTARFTPDFYPGKVQQILDDEAQLNATALAQLARRFSQSVMGMALSLFELPSTLFELSRTGSGHQSIKKAKVDNQRLLEHARHNLAAAQQRQQQLEREKQLSLKRLQLATQAYKNTLLLLQDAPPNISYVYRLQEQGERQKQRISQEQQELRQSKRQLAQIEARLQNGRLTLQRLQKITINQPGRRHARFDDARTHAFLNILRLIDIAEPGKLTEVKMLADDYRQGRFPAGFLPLAPALHQKLAQKHLNKLRSLRRADNRRRVNTRVPGLGSQQISLEDLFKFNTRLDQLLQLFSDADQAVQQGNSVRITVYLLRKETLFDDAQMRHRKNVSVLRQAQGEVKQVDSHINTIANDIDHHQQAVDLYRQRERHLKHLASQPIPSSLEPSEIKKGLFGLLGVVGVFEVMNLKASLDVKITNFTIRNMSDISSALIDCYAVYLTCNSAVIELHSGLLSLQKLDQFYTEINSHGQHSRSIHRAYSVEFMNKATLMRTTARANLVASAITSGIAGYDSYRAIKRGDAGAATGWGMVAIASTGLSIETLPAWLACLGRGWVFNTFTRLGPISLLSLLAGYGIVYFFADKPLKSWLNESPWGRYAFAGDKSKAWKTRPDLALLALTNLLMAPRVSANTFKAGVAHYQGDIKTHGYQGEACVVRLAVNLPGLSPGPDRVDLLLEYRDGRQPDTHFHSLGIFGAAGQELAATDKSSGDVGDAIDYFWRYAQIELASVGSGLTIQFYEGALYPLFKRLGTRRLLIRLRCRNYPEGKGVTLPLGGREFRLPYVPDHQPLAGGHWAEARVELAVGDYQSVWGALIHGESDGPIKG